MIAFWQKQPVAGMLFIPYLAWVSYASALNYAIWRLNRLG
jgi:benzodiazapine receptor